MDEAVAALAELVDAIGVRGGRSVVHPGLAADCAVHVGSSALVESITKQCRGSTAEESVNPAWSVIAAAIEQHGRQHGCGGWELARCIVGAWRALTFDPDRPLDAHRRVRSSADISRAATWVGDLIAVADQMPLWQQRVTPKQWHSVAASHMWRLPHASADEVAHVASVLVQAVVSVAQPEGLYPQRVAVVATVSTTQLRPMMRTAWEPGLILDFQLPLEAQLVLRGARGANDVRGAVVFTDALRACCHATALERLVDTRSVGIIFSQRTIDYALRALLARRGVVCIERLSIRFVSSVAIAIGATAVGAPNSPETIDDVPRGQAVVSPVVLGGKHHLRIRNPDAERFATLTVVVANPSAADETCRSVRDGAHIVCALLRSAAVAGRSDITAFLHTYFQARQALSGPSDRLTATVMRAVEGVLGGEASRPSGVNFFNVSAATTDAPMLGPAACGKTMASGRHVAVSGCGTMTFATDAAALPVTAYVSAVQAALETLSTLVRATEVHSFRSDRPE